MPTINKRTITTTKTVLEFGEEEICLALRNYYNLPMKGEFDFYNESAVFVTFTTTEQNFADGEENFS